jgi:transcriptional/translational regulatory protein YebC/TACO1
MAWVGLYDSGLIKIQHQELRKMESLLDSNENIGFCSVIETTKSNLFVRGCDVTSESLEDDDFWLTASVPTPASIQYSKLLKLIDALEDNDDVQEVYANFDISEEVLEAVAG